MNLRDTPEADVVGRLVARFRMEPIRLTEGAISVEAEEAQVDVSGDWSRDLDRSQPYFVPGIGVNYYVPFTGEAQLFKCRPGTFEMSWPRAWLRSDELAFRYEQPGAEVAPTKRAFDADLERVRRFVGWVNADVETFNASLPAKAKELVSARLALLHEADAGLASIGIPIRRKVSTEVSVVVAPSATAMSPQAPESAPEQYDVALSFAGEDREYVRQVAEELRALGVRTFYDEFERADLWGKNLIDHLANIYQNRARFVVVFSSQHYVRKAWTKHERQHAQARALLAQRNTSYQHALMTRTSPG